MANALLGFCAFIICWLVLFTDWFFPARRGCASCGAEMFRSTALLITGNVARHEPCWRCPTCGAVIEDRYGGSKIGGRRTLH